MIWKHKITAGHISPLEPDHKVFGSEKRDYFIITSYANGSHWMMKVADACALVNEQKSEPIVTHKAKKMYDNPTNWRLARDIWPEQYVEVEMLSPCCNAKLEGSRGDGVMIGSCSKCGENIVRQNPKTGIQERLDGKSPWTVEELRPVAVVKEKAAAA